MRKVIISCVPKLDGDRQQGVLNLIEAIERLDCKVFLWSDSEYAIPARYQIKKELPAFKQRNRFARFGYELISRLLLDKEKWRTRIRFWAGVESDDEANQWFNSYIKECSAVFAAIKPDYFICWNPYCCRFGVAYDMARSVGIKTRAIEWGYLPGTFLLDRKGTLAASTLFNTNPLTNYDEESIQQFRENGEVIFQTLKTESLSRIAQEKAEIPLDILTPDEGMVSILVLGIDEVDSGAYPADHAERKGLLPFHRSSYQQAHNISEVDKNYRVIYKPHPSHNKFNINTRVKPNLAIVNGNPDDLIDWADVVFCSGSKMEFSVIMRGKPLINYGTGLLYGKNCAYELNDPELIKEIIGIALTNADDTTHTINFLSFIGYLQAEYLYSFVNNSNKVVEGILNKDK